MTIRPAVDADVPRIVEMGKRFRSESSYSKHLAENPERMAQLAKQLIGCDGLLLAEIDGAWISGQSDHGRSTASQGAAIIGMIGYIMHSHFISGELVAGEVFWWMEPEHRGHGLKLLEEVKQRARNAGAKYLHMIAPSDRVARLYRHLGYEFVESTWQINL